MDQIKLHKKIDELLSENSVNIKPGKILDLISDNKDAYQWFFVRADEKWFDWLWKNGFLDVIKQKSDDPTRCEYKIPEFDYLMKISKKIPKKIVEIILDKDVATSLDKFNPGVINQFLRICAGLPAKELPEVIKKIRDDRWIFLMKGFCQWNFEYEEIFKILINAKDYESFLILAEAILSIYTKEEIKESTVRITADNPFYINDLSHIKIFKHLILVEDKYIEQALKLSTDVMGSILLLNCKDQSSEIFPINDVDSLFGIDFFTLELGQGKYSSQRDDIRELAAVIKILVSRLIDEECVKEDFIQGIYKKYIDSLPRSEAMWRLRLFVLSLCPKVFKNELKESFFKLFEVENYYEIISETAYEKTLRQGFSVLDKKDKRDYIKKVIEYFSEKNKKKNYKRENWHLQHGSEILSVIPDNQILKEEKQRANKLGLKFISDYEPKVDTNKIQGGSVRPRGPITQEKFDKLGIIEIVEKLKTDWAPEELSKLNKDEDFLNPLNAEGLSGQLRANMPKRLQEYIDNANLFFESERLNSHYTYSFLRGIQEIIKDKKVDLNNIDWNNLINFCVVIKKSNETPFGKEKRERGFFDSWLVDWTGVHSAMVDVIRELIRENNGNTIIDFSKYRKQIFEILKYLLSYLDPIPEDEQIETATSKTSSPGNSDYLVSDPFTMAINSVRGRTFETFLLFIYQDGKKFTKNDEIKISPDVKELYEEVLKNEKTRAIMFMFGHYFASFYYRDKEWIKGLLPLIFPAESEKKHLYTAAWEGYLAKNLYEEIFFDSDIQKLYKRGLKLISTDDLKQKHFKDPDEGIAVHLALAFIYYKDFEFDHELFKIFWDENTPEQHAKFVSFIGRSFISVDSAKDNGFIKEEIWIKKRLINFWDWILKKYTNKEIFSEFGFWIDPKKRMFDSKWLIKHIRDTLEKAKGSLNWDYNLMKSIVQFAEDAPEDTLAIARSYLFAGGVNDVNQQILFHVDNEWFETLEILYKNPITQSGTYELINDLIREGGSPFWVFKKILEAS